MIIIILNYQPTKNIIMKKNIFAFVAAAFLMIFMGSCSKEVDLAGTKWQCKIDKTITYQGIPVDVDAEFNLHFADAKNGSLEANLSITAMGQTQSDNSSSDFTYTFDGEEDGALIDEEGNKMEFEYYSKDKTIHVDFDSPEMESLLGISELVFQKQ